MSTVWFTSDLHLFHKSVAWLRETGRWPSPEERADIPQLIVDSHNDVLAARWDALVGERDVIWVLGDLTGSSHDVDAALDWIQQRPGVKHLVLGNHDPAHPMYSTSATWEWRYQRAFASIGTSRERYITASGGVKHRVLLSHFPYTGDGYGKKDRVTQHRLRDEGKILLHGHVHSAAKLTFSPPTESKKASIQIHVGVDAWDLKPVSINQVAEIIETAQLPEFTHIRCVCAGHGGSIYSTQCPIHDPSVDVRNLGWQRWYREHLDSQKRIAERLGDRE